MTFAFMIDKILTSSVLIFFFYSCFATLALSIAYLFDEELKEFLKKKREQREMQERSNRPVDAIVDEIYES